MRAILMPCVAALTDQASACAKTDSLAMGARVPVSPMIIKL